MSHDTMLLKDLARWNNLPATSKSVCMNIHSYRGRLVEVETDFTKWLWTELVESVNSFLECSRQASLYFSVRVGKQLQDELWS